MRVLVAGGGTAGHVFPGVALARRLSRQEGVDVEFVGTATGPEAKIVQDSGFAFTVVEAMPFTRKVTAATAKLPFRSLRAVRQCVPIVELSDAVVGMGGYVSVPAAIAALRTRTPLVLHEQNSVPGLANRLLARPARTVAVSFPETAGQLPRRAHTVVTGNPIREGIASVAERRESLAKEAIRELGLDEGRRAIVVFGGSQGALHIDRAAVGAARELNDRSDLQLVVLTGPAHLESIRAALPKRGRLLVRAFGFVERMELAYAVADLVVARAGATSIAEITACALPSLLIPYPYATGRHQDANARAVQRAGAAAVVADEDLTPRLLAGRISELLGDEGRLGAMGERAAAFGRPNASIELGAVVTEAAGGAP